MSQTIPAGQLLELKLTDLKPATDNPRRDVGDITELAESIKALGILEPILATQQNGHYLIVAGARRYAAAKKAGLKTVQVIVREFDEKDRISAMLVENLQRHDLTVMEEAGAFRRLIDECGMTQRDLALKVGRSQAHISKRLQLLDLPDDILVQVDSGGITIADAVSLARLADHPEHLKDAAFGQQWQPVDVRVQIELGKIASAKKLKAREEELESAAIATVRVHGQWNLKDGLHRLKSGLSDYQALEITPADHKKHSCHAIAIYVDSSGKVCEFPVCTDRKEHPKIKTLQEKQRATGGGGGQATISTAERARRDALAAAQERRVAFIDSLLAKKQPLPKSEAARVMAAALLDAADEYGEQGELELAAEWLRCLEPVDLTEMTVARIGITPSSKLHVIDDETESDGDAVKAKAACSEAGMLSDIRRPHERKAEPNAAEICHDCLEEAGGGDIDREALRALLRDEAGTLRLGVALALSRVEVTIGSPWGNWTDVNAAAHFDLLERHGYEISDVERERLPKTQVAA